MNHTATENIALSVSKGRSLGIDWSRIYSLCIGVSQFVTWPIAFILFNVIYRLKISGTESFRKIRGPFIIVANHISPLDSFVFRLALGFWTPHLPLRFMAVNHFRISWLNFLARVGVIDFIYGLFGVFLITPGQGIDKNLAEAKQILRDGGHIVIYPEGLVVSDDSLAPFKMGAAVLASRSGVPVIPVSFRFNERNFIRYGLTVNVGEPFKISPGSDTSEATSIIFDRVSGLFESK